LLKKKRSALKEECVKACWHLGNEVFGCLDDAAKSVLQLNKKSRFHRVEYTFEVVEKYECRGRPNPNTPKVFQGYRLIFTIKEDEQRITETLNKKRAICTCNQ
jgi:mRNA-degrading endonuclease RelE of RelBE toxin-antitoxin system